MNYERYDVVVVRPPQKAQRGGMFIALVSSLRETTSCRLAWMDRMVYDCIRRTPPKKAQRGGMFITPVASLRETTYRGLAWMDRMDYDCIRGTPAQSPSEAACSSLSFRLCVRRRPEG